MNERIKQLALQAGLTWRVQSPHYTNTNSPIDFPVSANRDLEKFAELLVEECCRRLGEETIRHDGYGYNQHELYNRLRKHFGVE
jgi:hypothetical protein